MRRSNLYVIILISLLGNWGCIEPYTPSIKGEAEGIYVVSGEVTNQEGYQYVTLSLASPIEKPVNIPVSGANMIIEDDHGQIFQLYEYEAGKYRVWMFGESLQKGTSFRIRINTIDGEELLSDFDSMTSCPSLDSIYYEKVEAYTNLSGNVKGLQFYADFAGTGGDSHYLRLSGEETWEYHSPFAIEYYYDGQLNKVDPPDSSLLVCWSTKPVSSVFTLATDNLVSNSFKMFPLHLADNTTTKLYIGYYLKVTLHSLSREAYDYWEQLRVNLNNQDGLYETQPLPVSGNVKNLTRPGKKVLGFFQASGISQKVIFIDGLKDLDISMEQGCGPYPLGRMGWREYTPASYPVYLVQVNRAVLIVDKNCVDCRQYGGNTVKPEFWPR